VCVASSRVDWPRRSSPCDDLAAMVGFDPKTATEAEIIQRAESLPGRLVGNLEDLVGGRSGQGKGDVGLTVERFFGIAQNALPEPDFPAAGIELKVVPLVHRGGSMRVKERTVITMIDYNSLVLETWTNAHVRRKLHILFVFFEHLPAESKALFPIRAVLLWNPDAVTGALLRADWERVRIKVRQGRATELSESDGRVLGPCTKGTDSTTLRDQPFSSVRAKSRAFALKPAFTFQLYKNAVGQVEKVESLAENIGLTGFDEFERLLLSRFDPYLGRTVGHVADELKVPPSVAKSYAAAVVRRIFGTKDFKSKIIEFQETGLTLADQSCDSRIRSIRVALFPRLRNLGTSRRELGRQRPTFESRVHARDSRNREHEEHQTSGVRARRPSVLATRCESDRNDSPRVRNLPNGDSDRSRRPANTGVRDLDHPRATPCTGRARHRRCASHRPSHKKELLDQQGIRRSNPEARGVRDDRRGFRHVATLPAFSPPAR